jgi:hypothetical protein
MCVVSRSDRYCTEALMIHLEHVSTNDGHNQVYFVNYSVVCLYVQSRSKVAIHVLGGTRDVSRDYDLGYWHVSCTTGKFAKCC